MYGWLRCRPFSNRKIINLYLMDSILTHFRQADRSIFSNNVTDCTSLLSHLDFEFSGLFLLSFNLRVNLLFCSY